MVVDDELGVRESLRAILAGDCDVSVAPSGEEALTLLASEPVDAVTVDLRMPGLSGIAVLERIKKVDPDIEVLIITGQGSLDTAIQGLRHRAFDYLTKPFDAEKVRQLVQAALARRQAVRLMKAAPESMLAGLSHEFRTPLNIIMGYSNMLREEVEELSDDQRAALDRIQANSSTLLAYVETLFYLAELDRGLVPLEVETVHVGTVVERVRRDLVRAAAMKDLAFTVEGSGVCDLTTDGDKVGRLLRTLAENAIRYTRKGRVVIAARDVPDGVVVEVRDSGPGLSPEVVEQVQEVASGVRDGAPPRALGFGLKLAGRLVQRLNGHLTIETGAEGTTVRVRLPPLMLAEHAAASA
jgi:signal transduction histidine kinase